MATSPNPFDQFDAPVADLSQHVPSGNPFDQFDAPEPEKPSLLSQAGRQAGLWGRAIINGITGMPAMAADAGVATRNLAYNLSHGIKPTLADFNPFAKTGGTHQEYELPSHSFNQALTAAGVPAPQNAGEKVANFIESGLVGSRMPAPEAADQAPANFVSPKDQQVQRTAEMLQQYRDKGLVVPPSTTNPVMKNKILETISGKEATQNTARAINQTGRNALAAEDLGLKPEVFTPEAVSAVKQEAGKAFEAARAIPSMRTDGQYVDDLTNVLKESHGSNASFPGSANPDVEKIVDTYLQPEFTGDSAVSAIKLLRGKATDAYRQGNSELGMAYKGVSQALEKQLERGSEGTPYEGIMQSLRQARQTYAKASTIEDVMDPAGNVNGIKLAAALRRGEPLTGGLRTAAEHAANYPKANLPANSSNISHLDVYAPLMSALMGHGIMEKAAGAAIPAARYAARGYLFTPWGQAGAIPGIAAPTMGALPMGVVGAQQSTR